MLAGLSMVTERFTTAWRGNMNPMTAINTTTTMSPVSIFLNTFYFSLENRNSAGAGFF
jgi:hypothetical protein